MCLLNCYEVLTHTKFNVLLTKMTGLKLKQQTHKSNSLCFSSLKIVLLKKPNKSASISHFKRKFHLLGSPHSRSDQCGLLKSRSIYVQLSMLHEWETSPGKHPFETPKGFNGFIPKFKAKRKKKVLSLSSLGS